MAKADPRASPNSEQQRLYRALQRHDPALDGQMFIGVTSTGIYCRPVCPVRVPKIENCTFHPRPAVAEKAGFRPCLVCRPELAPGEHGDNAVSRLARLALRRIEDGALNELSVDDLAAEFVVSARHLRRELTEAYGVSPVELAQTQRLLQAKQLLTETDMSITEVAFSAGFDSLRRFNSLFKARYRLAPTALRRASSVAARSRRRDAGEHELRFRIDYRPPFNWPALLNFLKARAIPGVEAVRDNAYLRTAQIGPHSGWLMVKPWPQGRGTRVIHALELTISDALQPVSAALITRIRNVFDTRADATTIDKHLGQHAILAALVKRYGGMRLPGAFDGFELLLRAILGQVISVKGATTLAGRMATAYGEAISTPWPELTHLTPGAERLARARLQRIARIGLPKKRAACIQAVARAARDGHLNLQPGSDPDLTCQQLVALPGIGEWTAAYVAMRALAWPDALPLGDLGIKKALNLTRAADIEAATEAWRPYRAYGAIYLWLSLGGG